MLRVLKWIVGLALLAVIGVAAWDVATFDRAGWQRDYAKLKREMAQGYANLDWIREHRQLDLARLDAETQASLDGAWSRVQAYLALRRFVGAFHDPHLTLALSMRGSPTVAATPEAQQEAAASLPIDDCEAAGYSEDHDGFAERWDGVTGWRPRGDTDDDFPIAMVGDTGILRIGSFDDARYLAACRRAFRAGMDTETLHGAARRQLNMEIVRAMAQLRAQGANRLLVDVTGNGGGSEWVAEVIALMTPRRLVRDEARRVAPQCDRSAIWSGGSVCPVLGGTPARAEIVGKDAWRGPLLIYADRGSASATEDFIAWLHQNEAAVLIGEKTLGAGCGYVNDGGRVRLEHAGVEIRMPNCARFLPNGTNEIEGQKPDIPLVAEDDRSWARGMEAVLRRVSVLR
ncbi:S41 family peptidase [Sphingomonas sp. DT-207]|uniref:S41 family peptidase n=1 Tax=Sphingomonas sp. DT-207 TaxID=3396167 RepID=UPI003F19365A